MAWNQPGNNGQDRDPWGSSDKGSNNSNPGGNNPGGNNQGGRNQGPKVDDLFQKINIMLGKLGGSGNGGGNRNTNRGGNFGGGLNMGRSLSIVALVLAGIWGATGFYTIQEGKEGVIVRLGQAQKGMVSSGLHWKPTFIDKVIEVDSKGNRDFRTSGVMLTSDENVVRVAMSVVYQVEDPAAFLFSVTNAESSLKQASDSALRSTIGKYTMERILTDGKAQISSDTQQELVKIISKYHMGLSVIAVNLENARPPQEVRKAFDDAISAREDEQRAILQAEAYSNKVIPEARGDAAILIANAKAYKEKVIKEAEGEVDQLSRLLPEYKGAPEVTRARLYISAMERIMAKTGKVMIDGDNKNIMVLPIDKLAGNNVVAGSNSALTNEALAAALERENQTLSDERRTSSTATQNQNANSSNEVYKERTSGLSRTESLRRGSNS